MSDDDIWALSCGGHDPQKVYAAYAAALAHTDQPTAILAKTVKGYGMGEAGEGQNITLWVPRTLSRPLTGAFTAG